LKKILLAIGEGPKSFSELEKVMEDVDRRTLYYNLDDLKALDLIFLDEQTGKYCSTKLKTVKSFNTKKDYELALKHSRKLILPNYSKGVDLPWIYYILERVTDPAFSTGVEGRDSKMLIQHIKTGYPEISTLLEKQESLNLEANRIIGKIREKHMPGFLKFTTEGFHPGGFLFPLDDEYWSPETAEHFAEAKAERDKIIGPWTTKEEKASIQEYEKVIKLMIGEVISLIGSVEHGAPLRGYCDYCPHHRVSIRD